MSVTLVHEAIRLEDARRVVESELAYLDSRQWSEWVELYTADCKYWVPTWKADGTLASDPLSELSYIYYSSRGGLEDRLVRIASPSSPAAQPLPRTSHILGYTQLVDQDETDGVRLRSSWVTHVFFPISNVVTQNFGQYEHDIVRRDGTLRIARKKTVIQNDYMETIIDIYSI